MCSALYLSTFLNPQMQFATVVHLHCNTHLSHTTYQSRMLLYYRCQLETWYPKSNWKHLMILSPLLNCVLFFERLVENVRLTPKENWVSRQMDQRKFLSFRTFSRLGKMVYFLYISPLFCCWQWAEKLCISSPATMIVEREISTLGIVGKTCAPPLPPPRRRWKVQGGDEKTPQGLSERVMGEERLI